LSTDPVKIRPEICSFQAVHAVSAGSAAASGVAPGRFHLYAGAGPRSQRGALVISIAGLQDAVSVSYVHPERDDFRATTQPPAVVRTAAGGRDGSGR